MNIILTKNFETELNDLPFIDYVKDKIKNAVLRYFKTKYISDYDIFIDDNNIKTIKDIIEDLEIEIDGKNFILLLSSNYLYLYSITNKIGIKCPYCENLTYREISYYMTDGNVFKNIDDKLEVDLYCDECDMNYYCEFEIKLIKVKK